MKTIDIATLAAVSGGIAQNTAASSWSRPGLQNGGGNWWSQPAPKWNAPSAPPTQPLGPWTPSKQWV